VEWVAEEREQVERQQAVDSGVPLYAKSVDLASERWIRQDVIPKALRQEVRPGLEVSPVSLEPLALLSRHYGGGLGAQILSRLDYDATHQAPSEGVLLEVGVAVVSQSDGTPRVKCITEKVLGARARLRRTYLDFERSAELLKNA